MSARVRKFYDRTAVYEDGRLDESVYRRLERDMTLRAVAAHVPEGASILDVGGGPGAYLEPLGRLGFAVSLCDLSPANVRLARARAKALGLSDRAKRVRRANAVDLGVYADASFDAALVAGPFYHLMDPEAQARALAELIRVVRPGGVLALVILPRLHPLRYLLREANRESLRALARLDWDLLLDEGRYENPFGEGGNPVFFTDAFLWDVGAFRSFLRRAACRVTDALSLESFCAFMDEPLQTWIRRERDYLRVLELVERTARREEQLGAAEHVLIVARTPRGRRAA